MSPANKDDKAGGSRSLTRLMAAQALYLLQMNTDADPKKVLEVFESIRLGQDEESPLVGQIDRLFFTDIVDGVLERREEIRKHLDKALTGKWTFARLEKILRAILEAGVYELLARPDVPRAVIINEYVNVTHAFYDGKEPGFVNGILDEIAKTLRS